MALRRRNIVLVIEPFLHQRTSHQLDPSQLKMKEGLKEVIHVATLIIF